MKIIDKILNDHRGDIISGNNIERMKIEIRQEILKYKDRLGFQYPEFEVSPVESAKNFSLSFSITPTNYEGELFLQELELLDKMENV